MSEQMYDSYVMTYISDQDDVYYPYFDFGIESLLMVSDVCLLQIK